MCLDAGFVRDKGVEIHFWNSHGIKIRTEVNQPGVSHEQREHQVMEKLIDLWVP